ncbi:MAG: glucosidase [Pyrinomonadaceae bacterium]|nr:glucosidase [Pyrinomonadaceae bacterium]
MAQTYKHTAEYRRLAEDTRREYNWKRWGPYLSERQWGTVREDYSPYGSCWEYFPHDHARSRAYRWGEDGLLGIADREARLCFALALWNERDPILKERLFGLTNSEGNHGEDVKECYFYLDSTPTHTYLKALYKYPQAAFPYQQLIEENRRRDNQVREFELEETGIFDDDRYFDIFAEYANATPNDILIRITVFNHGPETARLHLLPTLWFRNTWSWGRTGEGYWPKPRISAISESALVAEHTTLGEFHLEVEPLASQSAPEFLFTENETNAARLFGASNATPYVKDAFHEYVIHERADAVNPERTGTKAAAHYRLEVPARGSVSVHLRLYHKDETPAYSFGHNFDDIFDERIREADEFYEALVPANLSPEAKEVMRQAYAGLLWSKQFYNYIVAEWLQGDPSMPPPPARRLDGRNHDWKNLHSRDIISMPDKWEYPWFAAWDSAFHMIAFATIDPEFAKKQLVLFLREWYTHPNGQLPAYEFAFNDVNPPVHAWACWRVYKMATDEGGKRDRLFLERVFQKLLINFTWWVNRQDVEGKQLFSGGFLGLDNIGIFDRSKPLPTGGHLEQADGTAWMAFYCGTMLSMALELAAAEPEYEDVASKFFEHFVGIVDAMNAIGDQGLWDELDGFYYDEIKVEGREIPLRVRSMVGLIPLFAVENLEESVIERLPGFSKRMRWFLDNRPDLARHISYMEACQENHPHHHRLLAIPSRDRLERLLKYVLDDREFLSPFGVRSLSQIHEEHPFVLHVNGTEYQVSYDPGESQTALFGGNSNWRGPVWFPVNYLLIEALERYHHFYGDGLRVECPTGSGISMNLAEVADELNRRLASIFLPDEAGRSPWQGDNARFAHDEHWRDLVLFHEYFHGDTGRGIGASHQTGWTALVAHCLDDIGRQTVKAHLHESGSQREKDLASAD